MNNADVFTIYFKNFSKVKVVITVSYLKDVKNTVRSFVKMSIATKRKRVVLSINDKLDITVTVNICVGLM
jgi:hypothetical protein